MAEWHFNPLTPGPTIREPIQGEFFTTDAICSPGTTLIREGIQNALDAGVPGEKVRVRIYLSGSEGAIPASEMREYLDGAWDHFHANKNGLSPDSLPTISDPCDFLVFEDFSTTGLTGDPAQSLPLADDQSNHFFHFFRAEGRSDKGGGNRGSWGIGKIVFLRTGCISTIFGYTVRSDNGSAMLMGKTVLKSHHIDGTCFQEGWYGIKDEDSLVVMPTTDKKLLRQFQDRFNLWRADDAGLSIVIPWPDREVTSEEILNSVQNDYFYPILAGMLEVLVEIPGTQQWLEDSNFISELKNDNSSSAKDALSLATLANWSLHIPDEMFIELDMPDPSLGWHWKDELIPSESLEKLKSLFRDEKEMAIRVPVTIREKHKEPRESFFEVFLKSDPESNSERPKFIREGIIIPKVKSPITRNVRALVIASDRGIASFLRDAENPSHTEWQHGGSNFKGKYISGKTCLEFVMRIVHEIVRVLNESDQDTDPDLLAEYFSLPIDDESRKKRSRKRKSGTETDPPPDPPMPKPARFRIEKYDDGFSISPGDPKAQPPVGLLIRMAYDVSRGNALKKYQSFEFQVQKPPIKIDDEGIELIEYKNNRIVIRIIDSEFNLKVTGFDKKRDLYVKAISKELPDDGSPS